MMHLRNWRLKARLQRVFSAVPQGHQLNYAMQRTIGGLPLSDDALQGHVNVARRHVDALRRHGLDPQMITAFEFGAGFDLHMPLIQHGFGIWRHVLVDIRRLARPKLVVAMARRLHENPPRKDDWVGLHIGNSLAEVLAANNLQYDAPSDASGTQFADSMVDAVITSNTLEHIPPEELSAIYRECHRVLRPGGLMSMMIDYSDHWSHFDKTITAYNFLRFDAKEWSRWNPSLMFQNRLRHSEHLALLTSAGFELVDVEVSGNDPAGLAAVKTVPLASPYMGWAVDDLAITGSHLVLRRAGDA